MHIQSQPWEFVGPTCFKSKYVVDAILLGFQTRLDAAVCEGSLGAGHYHFINVLPMSSHESYTYM